MSSFFKFANLSLGSPLVEMNLGPRGLRVYLRAACKQSGSSPLNCVSNYVIDNKAYELELTTGST